MAGANDIVWEDPPPARGGPGQSPVWLDRLAPLREHPGEWANLARHHTSCVTNIRKGLFIGVEPGEYEAVGRDVAGGQCTLFVRYIGEVA